MSRPLPYVLFAALMAALGGFLFGYHTSVISGALLFLGPEFSLTTFQEELVVSTILIGALLGALGGGGLADRIGRKKTLFVTVALFLIGTLMLMDSRDLAMLLSGRAVAGLALGIASVVVPLYIAEIAPDKQRGAFVSLNQLLITVGILIAYIVAHAFAERQEWRPMFALALIPLAVQAVGLFFIPETHAWLTRAKQTDRHHHLRELFKPSIRRAFLVGIGLSVIQQLTGINTVIYYAPKIFGLAGYSSASSATFATLLVGIVNTGMTVVALWLIDRLGRRPLLLIGLVGMTVALSVLGASFIGEEPGSSAIIAVMVYVAFFAVSLGPVVWLIISEIYPLHVRGQAMGVAIFANWLCNYIVSLTFLTLLQDVGAAGTFWLYAAVCVLAFVFVWRKVPETKGKSLEQIQKFWHGH